MTKMTSAMQEQKARTARGLVPVRMKPEDDLFLAPGGLRAGNVAYSVAHPVKCQQPIHHH